MDRLSVPTLILAAVGVVYFLRDIARIAGWF
jgi:hypothetical protein